MSRLMPFFLVVAVATSGWAQAPSALLGSLPAAGPDPADSAHQLYSALRGDWDVAVTDYLADGSRHTGTGEWHFDWVLEGRAMQDVWISPRRGERHGATPSAFDRYGTTVRYYDPAIDAWRVTWVNPAQNYVATLVGRARGRDIVQEGAGDDGSLLRWTFSGMTHDAFSWRGEVSADSGRTWRTVQEMSGRRAATTRGTSKPHVGPMMDALIADGPAEENAEALRLFGQFVGSWDSGLLSPNADGTVSSGTGEIHMGWVLEGRALQDVWIFPKRGTKVESGHEYGTTIRFFDRAAGNWRSIWISPVNKVTRSFRVRADGDEIFLEARTARGLPQRWIFSAITPGSFHWRNIVTHDDGRTWQLLQDVTARRMPTPSVMR